MSFTVAAVGTLVVLVVAVVLVSLLEDRTPPRWRPGAPAVAAPARGGAERADVRRDLAAVLFAGYVAAGLPERDRVTGWVTASATPPGEPDLVAGADLRGRPGAVTRLLACTDGGRNWITLDRSTDVARGLRARPPTCEVLSGLLWWWAAVADGEGSRPDAGGASRSIPPEGVAELRRSVAAVLPHLHGNPLTPLAADLHARLVAAPAGQSLRIDDGGRTGRQPRSRAVGST